MLTGPATFEAYYGQERPEVLGIIPRDARRVLELGCGAGRMAHALKQRQDCHVTGIEYISEAAAEAAQYLDRVIVADCELLDLNELGEVDQFDCLIAADVLEHLRDPEALLARLLPYLTEDASVVVSVPNVRHAGVLNAAVEGRWTYQRWGILDRTHLRFFTRFELQETFGRLGFEQEELQTVDDPQLADWLELRRPTSARFGALVVTDLSESELREFFVVQWLMRQRRVREAAANGTDAQRELPGAAPPFEVSESPIRELEALLSQERAYVERLHHERIRSEVKAQSVQAELRNTQSERDALRAEVAAAANGISQLSLQVEQVRGEYAALQRAYSALRVDCSAAEARVSAMQASTSWRVTAPLREVVGRRPTPRRVVRFLARRARARLRPPHAPAAATAGPPDPIAATVPTVLGNGLTAAPAPRITVREIPCRPDHSATPIEARGKLICLSHVLPYPSRAGNEYRIHRMLHWLGQQGWDVILVVCPFEPVSDDVLTAAAQQYANLIVCDRSGLLHFHLRDGVRLVHELDGRMPRDFGEYDAESGDDPDLLEILRAFCPDLLTEVLLHLQYRFAPTAVLAEYVFMTRALPLLPSSVLKLIDTIDVFSTKDEKVQRFGISDRLTLSRKVETGLLRRADVVIAIQEEEAESLRVLAPDRRIITVGVDFPRPDVVARPPEDPRILVVGSANPLNLKGLADFLRFAWPLVRAQVSGAQLLVAGGVGAAADLPLPGVTVLGPVDDLDDLYAQARVVLNPTIAGTGLKIKTVEALAHARPVVVWPTGVEGLNAEARSLCRVARDWFEFAMHVIDLLKSDEAICNATRIAPGLHSLFDPDTVYAELGSALVSAITADVPEPLAS